MSCGKNVLLVGDEGIGKTSFVQVINSHALYHNNYTPHSLAALY